VAADLDGQGSNSSSQRISDNAQSLFALRANDLPSSPLKPYRQHRGTTAQQWIRSSASPIGLSMLASQVTKAAIASDDCEFHDR
jgi:hypothetical protein